MTDLPVAERWFRTEQVTDEITLLVEDHLDVFFESNVWHVRGRDRDLVVDTGNGIGDLRAELEPFADDRSIVAVATHHHFDHVGGLHAFDERWCHAADADRTSMSPAGGPPAQSRHVSSERGTSSTWGIAPSR